MTAIKKVLNAYKRKGLSGILRFANAKILTKIYGLPFKRIAVYNGIAVRNIGLLEKTDVFPDHEKELIDAIRKYVMIKENALVIGGGGGASSVVTAHQVGKGGRVITFEAVKTQIRKIQETVKLNKVEDIVSIRHAIIEKPIFLAGAIENTPLVNATDLPNCDVLIMDCEGAELPILQNIKTRPQKIIVETHSHFGSSDKEIKKILSDLGYKILENNVINPKISVIVASKN